MTDSLPPGRPDVVARLRAAGCVFAEDEAALLVAAARTADELEGMVQRRVTGAPLEVIIGWAQFCGLRIAVEPGVFVPRHRTEFLVRRAAAVAPPHPVVVDLCCGSGAIGAALLAMLPGAELVAADVEPTAVRCARRTLAPFGARVVAGDLFDALPADLRGRVDVLVANAPYVPTGAIALLPPEARDHEPRVTLDGGDDGLDVLRRVIAGAPDWLVAGGHLLFETGEDQAAAAAAEVTRHGMVARVDTDDDVGGTVVSGTLAV